ncbi:MAG: YceD family protein [Brachymonas sp.]
MSSPNFRLDRLDVRAFAQNAAQLEGKLPLSKLERLAQDFYRQEGDLASKPVSWQASGESVAVSGGAAQSWLHISIEAKLPMQCQRCLQGMEHEMQIERSFRFVKDEEEANAQDEDAEEDLLVASKQFSLLELIEDEILMALPFAPVHDRCPEPVKMQVSSDEFEAALEKKPNAFAALGALKTQKKAKP